MSAGWTGLFLTFSVLGAAQTGQRVPRQAEASTGAIEGLILHRPHLALAGARLVLRNDSGLERETAATGDGRFLFTDLPPGTYQVRAAMDGFEPAGSDAIRVDASAVVTLELVLEESPAPASPPPRASPPAPPYRELERPLDGETATPAPPAPPADAAHVMVPMSDRWDVPFPPFRRYDVPGDSQFTEGRWYDPYHQNKLKGDRPILGNLTFLNLSLISETAAEVRSLPLPPIGARFPANAGPGQNAIIQNLIATVDLFHGDAAYKPVAWRIRITPEISLNDANTDAPGLLNFHDPETSRFDRHTALQEAFAEVKLKDLSNEYDFVAMRAGIQGFNSDFRGFLFTPSAPGLRLFGTLDSNRYQYNLAAFSTLVKDPNSGLNTFHNRYQHVLVANLYRQDFFLSGYTIEVSFHYNLDDPSTDVNRDGFQVRPAPIGPSVPHAVRAQYYGIAGHGHIGQWSVEHAFYQAIGHDTYNAIAGRPVGINAQMAALEVALDRDWMRYRAAFFYASGDKDPRGATAHGFDAIIDNPNFAGGIFSFWNRQGILI